MEAGAAFRTLHPAITGKEVTAHAQGKAVGLVPTEELISLNLHDRLGLGLGHQLVGVPVVEDTLDIVQVHDSGMLLLVRLPLVDLLKPLHLAVAKKRIGAQKEFRNIGRDLGITCNEKRGEGEI